MRVRGRDRALALGGIVGPIAFTAAWATLGARAAGYSPVENPISRLAAVDAPTRAAMTGGLVAFGVGVPLFGAALRHQLEGKAWITTVVAGLTAFGVAGFPLGVPAAETPHGWFAGAGYVALAATPALASWPLARANRPTAAWIARGISAVSAACLAGTTLGAHTGLFQRVGLLLPDAWIVYMATRLAVGHQPFAPQRPARAVANAA